MVTSFRISRYPLPHQCHSTIQMAWRMQRSPFSRQWERWEHQCLASWRRFHQLLRAVICARTKHLAELFGDACVVQTQSRIDINVLRVDRLAFYIYDFCASKMQNAIRKGTGKFRKSLPECLGRAIREESGRRRGGERFFKTLEILRACVKLLHRLCQKWHDAAVTHAVWASSSSNPASAGSMS